MADSGKPAGSAIFVSSMAHLHRYDPPRREQKVISHSAREFEPFSRPLVTQSPSPMRRFLLLESWASSVISAASVNDWLKGRYRRDYQPNAEGMQDFEPHYDPIIFKHRRGRLCHRLLDASVASIARQLSSQAAQALGFDRSTRAVLLVSCVVAPCR